MFIEIEDIFGVVHLLNKSHIHYICSTRYTRNGQNVDGSYIRVGDDVVKAVLTVSEIKEFINGSQTV